MIAGTIVGGVIDPLGGTLTVRGGTLDGVTWNAGSLDVAAGVLTIENGITFATGAPAIGVEGTLLFAGNALAPTPAAR